MSTIRQFYVYELRDEHGVVFYVGRGSGARITQHELRAKRGIPTHCCRKIRSIWARGARVVAAIVFDTADEEAAFAEERRLIALYGRASLTNQTDGGDGPSNPSAAVREKLAAGRRGYVASVETRNRQRQAKLGTHRAPKTKEKIAAAQRLIRKPWARATALANSARRPSLGRKHTPETIERMRLAKLGHTVSEETRQKISTSKKGQAPWNKQKPSL